MRYASETRRSSSPSASKLHGRPAVTTSKRRLIVAVEQLVAGPARGVLVGQLDDGRAVPLHVHDGHEAVRQDAADGCAAGQVFESGHISAQVWKDKPRSLRMKGPRPHLLITNDSAKMMAAMPRSWDQQDAGVKPTRYDLVGFTA